MAIYRIWAPAEAEPLNTFCTKWHATKRDAWKEAKVRTNKTKKELKKMGYTKEMLQNKYSGDCSEQMALQGR